MLTFVYPIGQEETQLVALKFIKPGLQAETQLLPSKRKPVKHWVHVLAIGHDAQLLEQETQDLFYDLVPCGQFNTQLPEYKL